MCAAAHQFAQRHAHTPDGVLQCMLLLLLLCTCTVPAAPPIPAGRQPWKPQWDELKDFTDNEVIVSRSAAWVDLCFVQWAKTWMPSGNCNCVLLPANGRPHILGLTLAISSSCERMVCMERFMWLATNNSVFLRSCCCCCFLPHRSASTLPTPLSRSTGTRRRSGRHWLRLEASCLTGTIW